MNTFNGMGPQRGFQLALPGIRRQQCTWGVTKGVERLL
jgi:hypothetical protein